MCSRGAWAKDAVWDRARGPFLPHAFHSALDVNDSLAGSPIKWGRPDAPLCCPKGDSYSVYMHTHVRVHPSEPVSIVQVVIAAHLLTAPGVMGNPQAKSWVGWGNRFPERKDNGGGGKLQLNGAATPPPLHHRQARCVFSVPGSWGQPLPHRPSALWPQGYCQVPLQTRGP